MLSDITNRLESLDQICSSCQNYALLVDMRDFDALFLCRRCWDTRKARGQAGVQEMVRPGVSRTMIGSAHRIAGKVIDFETTDLATGLVLLVQQA